MISGVGLVIMISGGPCDHDLGALKSTLIMVLFSDWALKSTIIMVLFSDGALESTIIMVLFSD